jgi:hypothetical protein
MFEHPDLHQEITHDLIAERQREARQHDLIREAHGRRAVYVPGAAVVLALALVAVLLGMLSPASATASSAPAYNPIAGQAPAYLPIAGHTLRKPQPGARASHSRSTSAAFSKSSRRGDVSPSSRAGRRRAAVAPRS